MKLPRFLMLALACFALCFSVTYPAPLTPTTIAAAFGVSFLAIVIATRARNFFAASLSLAIFLFASAAYAADPVTTVDFKPLVSLGVEFLTAILVAVVPVFGGWLVLRVNTSLGLKIDSQQRAVIEHGLERAIAFGVEQAKARLPNGPVVDLKSAVVAEAVDYAQKSIPGALAHFNVTPARLAEMIASRFGVTEEPA